MESLEPNSNNKLIGFLIQMLGFSLFFFGGKELYYIKAYTWVKIGSWYWSPPPIWYTLPFVAIFILGIVVIAYGVIIFMKNNKNLTIG